MWRRGIMITWSWRNQLKERQVRNQCSLSFRNFSHFDLSRIFSRRTDFYSFRLDNLSSFSTSMFYMKNNMLIAWVYLIKTLLMQNIGQNNCALVFVHRNSVHRPQAFKQLPYLVSIYSRCDSEWWFHQPFLSGYSCGLDLGSTWITQLCPCWASNVGLFLTDHFSNWSRSPWILLLPCKEFSVFISPTLQLHFPMWYLLQI